jgi:hypothetical protein
MLAATEVGFGMLLLMSVRANPRRKLLLFDLPIPRVSHYVSFMRTIANIPRCKSFQGSVHQSPARKRGSLRKGLMEQIITIALYQFPNHDSHDPILHGIPCPERYPTVRMLSRKHHCISSSFASMILVISICSWSKIIGSMIVEDMEALIVLS